MAKRKRAPRPRTLTSYDQASAVELERLPAADRFEALQRLASQFESLVRWYETHPDSEREDEVESTLGQLGDRLSDTSLGRTLLNRLMTARARVAASKLTASERAAGGKATAEKLSPEERVAKAVKASAAASAKMSDQQKTDRARKAANARWKKS